MRRREGDGCPVAGALQLVGDKWTMLVVRDLFQGPKRTTELLAALHPISSRTLVGRLRDMEHDRLVERKDYGGSPPHVEYFLTARGRLLVPLLESLRRLGETLDCNECEDRRARAGSYCEACPHAATDERQQEQQRPANAPSSSRRENDVPVVLL
jgi:DNA-binding HxlR family transcriptional regulator